MKRTLLVGLLAILLLPLAGCYSSSDDALVVKPPTSDNSGSTTEQYENVEINYNESGEPLLNRGFWLKGSRVVIKNLYPTCCPNAPMQFEIGNGVEDGVTREVYVSMTAEDDKDLKGYEQLPEEYYDWFTIDIPLFVLEPGESQVINVTVVMPEGADYSGKKARCALLVLGYTVVGTTTNEQGELVNLVGNVPIGVASEFYIETY